MAEHFRVNHERLFRLLAEERRKRGVSWVQIAQEARVPRTTLLRIGAGRIPDGHNMVAILTWLGFDLGDLVKEEKDA